MLKVKPEKTTLVGRSNEVKTQFIIPLTYEDIVVNKLIWFKYNDYDENGEVVTRDKYSSNMLIMPVDFDFT